MGGESKDELSNCSVCEHWTECSKRDEEKNSTDGDTSDEEENDKESEVEILEKDESVHSERTEKEQSPQDKVNYMTMTTETISPLQVFGRLVAPRCAALQTIPTRRPATFAK